MATSMTSDIVYEYSCSICAEDEINKDSTVYCVNCDEYLCKSHLKTHNRFAGAGDHQLINKEDLKEATPLKSSTDKPDLPSERCKDHHGKLVDMYCQDHDMVACSVCISLKHRSCKDLFYIPDIAKDRVTDQAVQRTEVNMRKQIDDFTQLKEERQEDRRRLAGENQTCLDKINARRRVIDIYIDEQEQKIKGKLKESFKDLDGKLESDVNFCDEVLNELNAQSKNLTDLCEIKVSQKFVALKNAEKIVQNSHIRKHACARNRNGMLGIQFQVSNKILENVFGNLDVGHKIVYKTVHVKDINIKCDNDKSSCSCYDLCELNDGSIIITDWNNKNIKYIKYDTEYKVCDSLSMSNNPWGVCYLNDNTVAITVTVDKKVEFVTVKQTMSSIKSFNVDCWCYAILHYNDNLYIGHIIDSKVSVYDLQGNCLQTFSTNKDGGPLFGYPCHIEISDKRQEIIIADSKKGVIIIDMEGNKVTEHTYRNLTFGVCLDGFGNIVVADTGSKEIVRLGHGKASPVVLCKFDKKPLSVIFNRSGQLLVLLENSNHIKLFTVQYKYE